MKKRMMRLLCLIGLHKWEGDCDNVMGEVNGCITLGWWQCKRCAHSKLKFILR